MKLFELYADLVLDTKGFDKGVNSASRKGSEMATSLSSGMQRVSATTIALGHAMYDLGKQAARAVANFAKDAVSSYAETEQLLGGVETLFKNSSSTVIKNAKNAYKTAGMDANQYMQTVMSSSASLLQSLGGDTSKAAKYADMAVQDMSDNANKFGTEMASIQNAYQGFAKQNYSMLDNLKLGYGGTKGEMERLLSDAQAIQRAQGNNVKYSINNLSDVYEAIHVIQTEMGVTGTTAKEAASTISGSFNSFKAAWSNAIIGLGSGDDMGVLVDNLFETGETLVSNVLAIVPKIGEQALAGIDRVLSRVNIYRTLKNAYKVGSWDGLASAAVASFKTGVEGFGDWAIEKGSEFLAGLWNGLTGDDVSAEKIKGFMTELFGAAATVLEGLGDAGLTVFQWVKENGASVASAIGPMAAAFTALKVAVNPLAIALTGIVAFTTNWEKFEESAPSVVAFFEDLTGLDFSNFIDGIDLIKTTFSEVFNFIKENPEIVSAITAAGSALAVVSGHPAIAAGMLGVSFESSSTAMEQAEQEQKALDEWAASKGYQKDQDIYVFGIKTGEDYSQEAYAEYARETNPAARAAQHTAAFTERDEMLLEMMSGIYPSTIYDDMDKWAASKGYEMDTPVFFMFPWLEYGKDYSPEVYEEFYREKREYEESLGEPDGTSGKSEDENTTNLAAAIESLSTQISQLPEAVQSAASTSIQNVTVEMDGEKVGQIVSRNLARHNSTAAKTKG